MSAQPTPRMSDLLARAAAAGVAVEARGDRLHLRGKRAAEPLMRAILARKAEVLAALVGGEAHLPEAETILAEVRALLPRVNANWRSYIATRLEVDAGSADRLRRVRDWTLAHAELAPARGPDRDAALTGTADD